MSKKTLSVLIVSDGRAGHLHRSEGVVLALKKKAGVSVEVLPLHIPNFLPKAMLPRMARWFSAASFLKIFHKLDSKKIARPDLIISAGGKTIGANAALAKLLNVPNIYVGKLRGMPTGSIALSFNGAAAEREIHWTPVKLDPDDFTAAQKPIKKIGFLVGGATKLVPFEAGDWEDFLSLVDKMSSKVSVVLATSPRTPQVFYDKIQALSCLDKIEFIDFRVVGAGSSQTVFACDAVVASADSTTMLVEAIAAKRPVIGFFPTSANLNKEYDELKVLEKSQRIKFMQLPLKNDEVLQALDSLKPVDFSHLDVLAEAIFADLPELN